MKKILPFLIAASIPICTSVEEIKNPARANAVLPVIRIVKFDSVSSAEDYKLREKRNSSIKLVLRRERTEGKAQLIDDVVYRKFQQALDFPDVRLTDGTAELENFPASPESRAYLKKADADAVASIAVTDVKKESSDEPDRKKVHLRLLDPVSGALFAERTVIAEVLSRKGDAAHQVDYYREGDQYFVLEEKSGQVVALRDVQKKSFRPLIRKTVTGKLDVFSSAADCTVHLLKNDRKIKLGHPPVLNYVLDERVYKIEVERLGYKTSLRKVQIRAGLSSQDFIPWPDDREIGAMAVFSAPAGLRLAVDGVVKGYTPVYLTNMEKGTYNVELARLNQESQYEVATEASLVMGAGVADSRVFFVNYSEKFEPQLMMNGFWQLTSEENQVRYVPRGGLAFQSSSKVPVWQGLVSRRFPVQSFELTLDATAGKGNILSFGIITDNESALVEMDKDAFTFLHFRGGELAGQARSFKSLSKEDVRKISFRYNHEKKRLTAELDGSDLYDGPWEPSNAGRAVILTRPSCADGRTLAKSLTFKSGKGLGQ